MKKDCGLGWVGILRAKCLCGRVFEITVDEARGRSPRQTVDMLLDAYNAHRQETKA